MKPLTKTVLMMALSLSLVVSVYAQETLWNELMDRAATLYQQGRYSEATIVAEEALKVAKKTFGSNHPNTAASLNNLAELYCLRGRFSDAEPLYKQALKIMEKALGPDHPDVATVLENMAKLYKNMGKRMKRKDLKNAQKGFGQQENR